MENVQERPRHVDVESLDPEHAERIGGEIGKMISKTNDEVAQKFNKILGIYGLRAIVAIQLVNIKTGETIKV